MSQALRQNLTVSLTTQTIQKVKVLAAQRSTSISALIAEQVETMVGENDAYATRQRSALALMKRGFDLGGAYTATRDELHER